MGSEEDAEVGGLGSGGGGGWWWEEGERENEDPPSRVLLKPNTLIRAALYVILQRKKNIHPGGGFRHLKGHQDINLSQGHEVQYRFLF